MAKAPENLSEAELEERTNAHPMAVPFLFLVRKSTIKNFMWLPIAGMIICTALGLIYPPHHTAPWDFFGSWTVIGFAAYSFVVLSAGPPPGGPVGLSAIFQLLSAGPDLR